MIQDGELVVAVRRVDGSIDSRYIQPLNEFLYHKPCTDIVLSTRGEELVDLLTNDLGVVRLEDRELRLYLKAIQNSARLQFDRFDQHNDVLPIVISLVGYLAEALIVKQCNKYPEKNRLWGRYARRSKHKTGSAVETLDGYIAIATGLHSTKIHPLYRTKYNPNDTQRDIIWLKKDELKKELARTGSSSSGYHPAGLQIKVSTKGYNVFKQLKNKKEYEVPVVYFDLKRDFEWVAEQLRQNTERFGETRWDIGVDLICGRSVDPEIYDTLLQFLPILEKLVSGRLEVSDLLNELPEFGTAITRGFIEKELNQYSRFSPIQNPHQHTELPNETLPCMQQLSLFDTQKYITKLSRVETPADIPQSVQILTLPI